MLLLQFIVHITLCPTLVYKKVIVSTKIYPPRKINNYESYNKPSAGKKF